MPEPPAYLSPKERFEAIRKSLRAEVISGVLVSLLVLFPVITVFRAASQAYDAKNSASGFLIAVIFIGGFLVLGSLCKMLVIDFANARHQYEKIKNEYLAVAPPQEESALRKRVILWAAFILLISLLVILLSAAP